MRNTEKNTYKITFETASLEEGQNSRNILSLLFYLSIMNGAHYHLILSHIPIVGAGFTMLFLIFALVRKSKELKRTALWFAVISGITSIAAYFTGDSAEEIVTGIPGITETLIEPHENCALFYLLSLLLIALIALAGLFLSRASATVLHKFTVIILVLSLFATLLAIETALTGGKIRHTEIETVQTVNTIK